MKVSNIKSHINGRNVKTFSSFDAKDYQSLDNLGINVDEIAQSHATDALDPTYTGGSANTPVQFLQNWLPGFVRNLTTARKIDELLGIATVGSWEDEEVIQRTMELTGNAKLYGDTTVVPYTSYNTGFEKRSLTNYN